MFVKKAKRFFDVPMRDDEISLVPKESSAAKSRWWKKSRTRPPAVCGERTASTEEATEDCVITVQPAVAPAHDETQSLVRDGPPAAAKTRKKTMWWKNLARLVPPSGRTISKCTPAAAEEATETIVLQEVTTPTDVRVVSVQPAVAPAHDQVTSLVRDGPPATAKETRCEPEPGERYTELRAEVKDMMVRLGGGACDRSPETGTSRRGNPEAGEPYAGGSKRERADVAGGRLKSKLERPTAMRSAMRSAAVEDTRCRWPTSERTTHRVNTEAHDRDELYAELIGWDPSKSAFRDHKAYLKFMSYYFVLA